MPATSWFVPIEYDGPGGTAIGRPIWFVNDPDEEPDRPEQIYLVPVPPTTGQIWPRSTVDYSEDDMITDHEAAPDPHDQYLTQAEADALYQAAGASGGSVILSGTAAPTNGVGAVGDYYLDTDDSILYGPKLAGGAGADQYIETASSEISGGGAMVGMRHRFLAAGQVTGVRLRPASASILTGWEVYLFSNAGTMLASKDAPSLTANTWVTVLFDAPVTITPNTTYVVAVWVPSGNATMIGDNAGAWAGQTSGDVRILADNEDGRSAVFNATRDTFPATFAGVPTYQLSAVFVGTVNPWPVALEGGFHVGTSAPSNTTLVWVDTS